MKPSILIVLLLAVAHSVAAQIPDSIRHRYDSLSHANRSRIDSTSDRVNQRVDQLQLKMNSLLQPDVGSILSKRKAKTLSRADSLRALDDFNRTRDDTRRKIDSLRQRQLPTDRYQRQLDSLNQVGPAKYIAWFQDKQQQLENKVNEPVRELEANINRPVDQIEDKINKPIDRVENAVNGKLEQIRSEGGNLPGNIDSGNLELNTSLPSIQNPVSGDLDKNLPNTGIDINNPVGGIDNPLTGQTGLQDKVSDLKGMPQEQIDKLKSNTPIQNAQEKMGGLNADIDKVQGYQSDVKNIADGNLSDVKSVPEAIENKAASLDEIKELQKQGGEMAKAQEMLKAGNDPNAMKELAMQNLTPAKDHFAGKEQLLAKAMQDLSKVKQKYEQVQSIADLKKLPRNPLHGKPLIERILPGITLQIQKSSIVLIDINPSVAYRITGHLQAGIGWNERLAFSKWNKLSSDDRIFGPRTFASYSLRKGFVVKAELEKMNALIPVSTLSTDAGTRQWVWSAFVGLKKEYKFIKSVNGNVQILYNLYDDHDNSPYLERLNVRMGFEFPMKKKTR